MQESSGDHADDLWAIPDDVVELDDATVSGSDLLDRWATLVGDPDLETDPAADGSEAPSLEHVAAALAAGRARSTTRDDPSPGADEAPDVQLRVPQVWTLRSSGLLVVGCLLAGAALSWAGPMLGWGAEPATGNTPAVITPSPAARVVPGGGADCPFYLLPQDSPSPAQPPTSGCFQMR